MNSNDDCLPHTQCCELFQISNRIQNSMRSSSNECRLNLISNEMKTIKAKPYAQQWHLYPDDKLLCLIMTSTQTRTCTSAYMCDVDAWWKVVSMAWLWHEIKEAPATSQTMEKYVQSYRKLCHSNWCSFELLWDNDYASIWIYILQKHTDSDWKWEYAIIYRFLFAALALASRTSLPFVVTLIKYAEFEWTDMSTLENVSAGVCACVIFSLEFRYVRTQKSRTLFPIEIFW